MTLASALCCPARHMFLSTFLSSMFASVFRQLHVVRSCFFSWNDVLTHQCCPVVNLSVFLLALCRTSRVRRGSCVLCYERPAMRTRVCFAMSRRNEWAQLQYTVYLSISSSRSLLRNCYYSGNVFRVSHVFLLHLLIPLVFEPLTEPVVAGDAGCQRPQVILGRA